MPTMRVDPDDLRALAARLRNRADEIDGLDPRAITTGVLADARLVTAIEQAGSAILRAYRHMARCYRTAADLAVGSADAYAESDRGFAVRLDLLCLG